jgi:CheY-like chemotaxis protein
LPHFPLDVFSGLTRPVETIDALDLSKLDVSQLDPAADALLVDVSLQGLDPRMLTKLKEWTDDGGRLALLYDLNPELHNPDQHINELKILKATVLSQPVSPTQIDKFLHALLEAPLEKPQEASDADVEEAEEEVKEQSQTKSSVADTPSSQSKDTPSETPTYSGHVLLVEDNMVNQLVAGSMLEQYGLSFDLAENGQEAVDMVCKGTHYDFVLMDVQMPVMDGYTSTSTMREKGFDELKICGLSANALQEDKDKGFAAGMNDYITKPIEPEKLEGIVKKYLC